ncbi:Ski complex subunit Rec14 [Microbotryomycetes sp. JL221]|nr:Ski complex subunit Rec14 [Microbotryomycetes sp. JL221]
MSATFLLAHVSEAGPSSSLSLPNSPSLSTPSTPNLANNDNVASSTTQQQQGHKDAIWCSKWAKLDNSDSVVVTGSADHTVKLWNPINGSQPQVTIRPPTSLGIVSLDVDKNLQGADYLVTSSLDSVISRFDMQGQPQGRKELGPAGGEGKVKVMSAEADEQFGQSLLDLEATGNFGSCVQYSQSGKLLAVASDTGYITLFDSETGQLVSTFPAHSSPIRSVAFTSSLLITGSDDKRINVFDMRAITSATSASGSIGNRRGQVASLGGHEGWVTCVEARNDRLLASGSADGTIKLFDLASPGAALNTLRDHTGDVWTLSWAPETTGSNTVEGIGGASAALSGGQFISGGEDGKLRWWRGGG